MGLPSGVMLARGKKGPRIRPRVACSSACPSTRRNVPSSSVVLVTRCLIVIGSEKTIATPSGHDQRTSSSVGWTMFSSPGIAAAIART